MVATHVVGFFLVLVGLAAVLNSAFTGEDAGGGGLALILGVVVVLAGPVGLAITRRSKGWAWVAVAYLVVPALLMAT